MMKYHSAAACALIVTLLAARPGHSQALETGSWNVLMLAPQGQYEEAEFVVRRNGNSITGIMNWRTVMVAVTDLTLQADKLSFNWNPYFKMSCRFIRESDGQFMGSCIDENGDVGPVILSPPDVALHYADVDVDTAFDVWGMSREEYEKARRPPSTRISYEELEPVPSKTYDVQGRSVNAAVAGKGDVTVVFESGLGDDHTVWQRAQASLADRTRTLSYDRPGLGLSEQTSASLSYGEQAQELRRVLDATNSRPPYVLVGHGSAAFTLRAFADAHPKDVAGLVLIDPAHAAQDDVWSALDKSSWQKFVRNKRSFLSTVSKPAADEFEIYLDQLAEPDEGDFRLDVPAAVLSAQRPADKPSWVGETAEGVAGKEKLHRELAEQLGARYVPVDESTGYIHLDKPDVVVTEVERILSDVRDGS